MLNIVVSHSFLSFSRQNNPLPQTHFCCTTAHEIICILAVMFSIRLHKHKKPLSNNIAIRFSKTMWGSIMTDTKLNNRILYPVLNKITSKHASQLHFKCLSLVSLPASIHTLPITYFCICF